VPKIPAGRHDKFPGPLAANFDNFQQICKKKTKFSLFSELFLVEFLSDCLFRALLHDLQNFCVGNSRPLLQLIVDNAGCLLIP
jgi:hypothetical protein